MVYGVLMGIALVFAFAGMFPELFCMVLVFLGLGSIFGKLGNVLQKK